MIFSGTPDLIRLSSPPKLSRFGTDIDLKTQIFVQIVTHLPVGFGVLIDPERHDEGLGHFTELTHSVTKIATPITQCLAKRRQKRVLYSLYWVFWGGVQKKEVKKGKIVVTDVQVSTAACI